MDDELIKINKIKNIEYISFYDYTIPNVKDGNGRAIIAPALMIKANGEFINYSIVDKYFRHFVHKVISVYHKEQKEIDDDALPVLVDKITIDDRSRSVLEKASFLERNEITGFYQDKDSYENSLIFQTDEMKSIMDIISYAIQEFSKFANIDIKLSDNYSGYRNNYVINAEKNGAFTNIIINYAKTTDNIYHISIGNIGDVCQPYVIDIGFLNDQIRIEGKYKDFVLSSEFLLDETGGKYIYKVTRSGKIIAYDVNDLECCEQPYNNLVNLDYENRDLTWYKLPWLAFVGTKVMTSEIDENTNISTSQIIYLDIIKDNFYKREFYTKKLSRGRVNRQKPIRLVVDSLRKITFGFKNDDYYLIETNFYNGFGDGDYLVEYNNRYFYHLFRGKGLKDIKKDELIPVTKDVISTRDDLNIDEKVKRIGEMKDGSI